MPAKAWLWTRALGLGGVLGVGLACGWAVRPAAAQFEQPEEPAAAAPAEAEAPEARSIETEEGRAYFRRAVAALEGLKGLEARLTLSGDGSIKNYLPSGTSTLRLARLDPKAGSADEMAVVSGPQPFAVLVEGAIKTTPSAAEKQVAYFRNPNTQAWKDFTKQVVEERGAAFNLGALASLVSQLSVEELAAATPFEKELASEQFGVLPVVEVDGVPCDVVEVTYPANPNAAREGARVQRLVTPVTRWYFAQSDRLLRRVDRVNKNAIASVVITQTLTGVTPKAEADANALFIETPEGWTRNVVDTASSKADRANRGGATATTPAAPAAAAPAEPAAPAVPKAPDFSFKTAAGDTVTRDSLAGNVTVLYFWGTWCVPCRQFSPLVSGLAEKFQAEDAAVRVFAPAIRERSVDAPKAYFEEHGYKHTLALGAGDTPGADAVARAFRVAVYPTLVVISPTGEVVATEPAGNNRSPEEVVAAVEKAVRTALPAKEG